MYMTCRDFSSFFLFFFWLMEKYAKMCTRRWDESGAEPCEEVLLMLTNILLYYDRV